MSNFLTNIAADINREHELAEQHAASAVEHARRAGVLLLEAKAMVEHGGWLPWLAANVPFSERTAQRYARIAEKLPQLPPEDATRVSDLPLRQAIAYLADERSIVTSAREIFAERTEARRGDRMERLATIAATAPPSPSSLAAYSVILADPPWQYANNATDWRKVENHYPTMPLPEICGLLADTEMPADAILFLWVPCPLIPEGVDVMRAWGFTHKTAAVWDKLRSGNGYYFLQRTELLLVGMRGEVPPPTPSARPQSLIAAARREHSRKPDEVYELIERMYPTLPKVELFARGSRPGWAVWGNQTETGLEP